MLASKTQNLIYKSYTLHAFVDISQIVPTNVLSVMVVPN